MDSNDATIFESVWKTTAEGEWLMTDSAMGAFVPSHGGGSEVVVAVSSKMVISYSVKA